MSVSRAAEGAAADGYVCPDCKAALVALRCPRCAHQYGVRSGFPVLLSNDARYDSARAIVDTYDSIYTEHTGAWENQGRSREFIRYFSDLLGRFPGRRFLEVGFGEGVLLAEVPADEAHGAELSTKAMERARAARPAARLCVALGERLPYPDGYFDLVASVGVMEHFVDDVAASSEIGRVLREHGRYVALIHVALTGWQSLQQKISEYVFPRPRPVLLAKWLLGKFYRPIHQPVQNRYTIASARACLERSGFEVTEVIHRGNTPGAPLIGPHVIIYVCRKPAGGPPAAAAL